MAGTSLSVAMIGQALAQARGLVTKHAIKQVDRLLSNERVRDAKDAFRDGDRGDAHRRAERRDRLLLVNAFAMALLTMLDAARESLGMDRLFKSNTTKTRTHSLFRQGCMWYELIPTMPDQRLQPLLARFGEMLADSAGFGGLFAPASK